MLAKNSVFLDSVIRNFSVVFIICMSYCLTKMNAFKNAEYDFLSSWGSKGTETFISTVWDASCETCLGSPY